MAADDRIEIRFGAQTSELEDGEKTAVRAVENGSQQMASALDKMANSARLSKEAYFAQRAELEKLPDGIQRIIDKYNPLSAKLRSLQADFDMFRKKMGNVVDDEVINTFEGLTNEIEGTKAKIAQAGQISEESFEKLKKGAQEGRFATAGVTREMMVLGHEAISGNFSRMPGSLMVLASRLNMTSMLLSPVTWGIVAAGVATVGLGAAVAEGAAEERAMNEALILTGKYAGVTTAGLNSLAHSAVAMGGNIKEAKDTVTQLANSGKFTSEQILQITSAVSAMGHSGKVPIQTIIGQFESLAATSTTTHDSISKAAAKLDDQYHFLTLAVYDQIKALEEEGRYKEASSVATDALARATQERAKEMEDNLGNVAKAWRFVKDAVGEVRDSVNNWGKDDPAAMVRKWDAEVNRLTESNAKAVMSNSPFIPIIAQQQQKALELANAIAELTKWQKRLSGSEDEAAQKSKEAQAQQDARRAADQIDITMKAAQEKSLDALTLALKKYHDELGVVRAANPEDPRVQPEAVKKGEKAIRDSFPTTSGSQMAQWTEDLERRKIAENDYFKDSRAADVAFWQSKLALVAEKSKEWLEVKGKIFSLDKSLAVEAVQAELARLKGIEDDTRKSWDDRIQAAKDAIAKVASTYGTDSKEYQAALNAKQKLDLQYAADLKRLAQDRIENERKLEAVSIAIEADRVKSLGQQAKISAADQLALTRDLENRSFALEMKGAQDKAALEGLTVKEKQTALAAIELLQANHQRKLAQLDQQESMEARALEQGRVETQRKTAEVLTGIEADRIKFLRQQGAISAEEEIALTREINQRIYEEEIRAARERAALLQVDTKERQAADSAIELIEKNHKRQMAQLDQEEIEKSMAKWHTMFGTITGGFSNVIKGMVNRTMTLQSAMISLADTIAGAFIDMGVKVAADEAKRMIFSKAEEAADANSKIGANAAVAGSAAFASTAAIPIVGPEMAPAAAAAAYSGAMSFAPMAFAERGFDIPSGINPVTQLHQKEMVLPADLAERVRSMTTSPQQLRPAGSELKLKGVSGSEFVRVADLAKEIKKLNRKFAFGPRFVPA